MSAPYLGLELRLDQLLELHRPRVKGTTMSNDKLQAQLDRALAVLAAQRAPKRYIVRPAKPRRGGKKRTKLPTTRGAGWRYCENCGMKRPGVKVVAGRHLCTRCRGGLKR